MTPAGGWPQFGSTVAKFRAQLIRQLLPSSACATPAPTALTTNQAQASLALPTHLFALWALPEKI